MDVWREMATELLGSVGARTVTRDSTDIAQRKLLMLRRVLSRLIEGALPSQINLAEIDVEPVGFSAAEFLQGALHSLGFEGAIHARAGVTITLCGSVHPNLRSTPRWEAWRHDHDATVVHVDAAILRQRHALARAEASAVAMAASSYRHLSARWTALMLAAKQLVRDARTDARAALEEADLMRLAVARELGSAGRLFEVGMSRRTAREGEQPTR